MVPISLLLPLQVSPAKPQQWPVLRETAILLEHGFNIYTDCNSILLEMQEDTNAIESHTLRDNKSINCLTEQSTDNL